MRKCTNRGLFISCCLHIALILAVSPFLSKPLSETKQSLSVVMLKLEPKRRLRRQRLRTRAPMVTQTSRIAASISSLSARTYAPHFHAPEAPVQAELVPQIVTHADIPQKEIPAMRNAGFGMRLVSAAPIAIKGCHGIKAEVPWHRGYSTGRHFANQTQVEDFDMADFENTTLGLGLFNTDVIPGHGLIGEVYVPGAPLLTMPIFELFSPLHTFVTANLDVPPRDYTEGFPTSKMKVVTENFAIRFQGELAIDTPGQHIFWLYSDDGARLYVNGKLIVDNDGIHAPQVREGSVWLPLGMHPVEIHYFQGPRYTIALQWFYQPPKRSARHVSRPSNTTKSSNNAVWVPGQVVPPEVIYRPGKPRIPDALKKLQERLKNIKNIKPKTEMLNEVHDDYSIPFLDWTFSSLCAKLQWDCCF